jgi:tRNA (guanine37-N1)-methyltransferase
MKPMSLKEYLKDKLNADELSKLVRAYDIVGDIAIIEVPEELEYKQSLIGNAIIELNKNIKVVCKKAGIHEGEFRTQKLDVVAGENRKETLYKENGVRLILDVEKVYFSPRSSTERKRIAGLVKKGENVLVMFSGIAPFPLVIAKNSEAKEIYGIEKNPVAHKYALKNIALNKVNNIKLFLGDVYDIVPGLAAKFDRIIMPLPKTGEKFLDLAFSIADKSWIHYYDFMREDEFETAKGVVRNYAKNNNKKVSNIDVVKAGQYGPRINRICVDFFVE